MAQQPESKLTVQLPQRTQSLVDITEWYIDSAYLVSTDGFSFTAIARDPKQRRSLFNLELEPVELLVGGTSQLVGRIDVTDIGGRNSAVTCEGRDYIADLVECNVDPQLKIGPKTQLADALQMAMGPCGITEITDFENVLFSELRTGKPIRRGARQFRKRPLQDYKPKPGEGIYEFANRLVARHGATLQPGRNRNEIVIDAPNYTQEPMYDLVRTDDPKHSARNTIVEGRARRDYSTFPTFTLLTGTGGAPGEATGGLAQTFDVFELVAHVPALLSVIQGRTVSGRWKTGEVASETKRGALYRLLYHRDQEARTSEDLQSGLRRAIAERLKDTLAYTCTVKGHRDPKTGAVYSVNTMANVDDAITGVHEPLWIAKRTLRFSSGQGATTELELWRPGSFVIEEGTFEEITRATKPAPAGQVTFRKDAQQYDPNTGRPL